MFNDSKQVNQQMEHKKLHTFVAITKCKTKIKAQEYSFTSNEAAFSVSSISSKELLKWEKINEYVTCKDDDKWWLAYVLKPFHAAREIKVKFLHPSEPATSFSFPRKYNFLTVPHPAILSRVPPITATNRTFALTQIEISEVTICLK